MSIKKALSFPSLICVGISFLFVSCHSISVSTSISASSISPSTSSGSVSPSTETYVVRFFNCLGEQIGDSQKILKGENAVEPNETLRKVDNFTFYGWDHSYQNISKDTNVYGLYYSLSMLNTDYSQVCFDADNGTNDFVIYVKTNVLLPEPINPTKTNYSFVGWFLGNEKWNFDIGTITSNTTLVAHWSLV